MEELDSQDIEELLQELEKDQDTKTTKALQYLEQASASKEQGELERALEQSDAALQLDPTLAEAYNLRGTILAAWAREDEAILAFREALRIDPDFAAARENLLAAEAELEAYGISPPPETLQCIGRTQGRRCPQQPIYKCQTCDALLCYEHAKFFRSSAAGPEQSEYVGIYCPAHYRQAVAEHNAQAKGRRGAQASQPLCGRGNGEECLTYSGFDCGLEVCKLCGQGAC